MSNKWREVSYFCGKGEKWNTKRDQLNLFSLPLVYPSSPYLIPVWVNDSGKITRFILLL